ncbi:MAG TPA: hypothetical protein VMY06_02280 [Sedimentisphaerales bacterium]|nr:hypothetical protein [Sedimentisphaerales bacterium]
MKPDSIEKILNKLGTEDVPPEARQIAQKMSEDFSKTLIRPRQHIFLEYIMKSKITKLAAAAVIIVAVLVGLHFVGNPLAPTVTWAKVIQPILNAQTATLDILIGSQENQHVIHDEVMGSRIRRTFSDVNHSEIIIDLEQQKMLTFEHATKTAVFIELGGLDNFKNYLEELQDLIIRLQDNPDFQVEDRGLQKIEGRDHIVFVAESQKETITIWADPETALPTRIEQKTPNMQIVCDNLQFDVVLDESRFSMKVPDDYTIQNAGIDFRKNNESDFIETLRIWAEIIEDGHFPDSINLEDVVKVGPKFEQGLKRANLTEQQQLKVATRFGQGLVFIRFFKGQGKWHWNGVGVELGDAETPIFWYRPEDSETYRVIYGDLHVEDVAPEGLPEPIPAEETAEASIGYQKWSKSEFVGTQEDLWYIEASGDIGVRSDLTLLKGPEGTNVIPISLPYAGGKLTSVTLDKVAIPFRQMDTGRYELELPLEKLFAGQTKIRCKWTLSLDMLEKVDKVDYGYRTVLKSLIPVVSYRLRVSLAPDSGFEFTKDTSKKWIVPFTFNAPNPHDHFGSCGIQIRKRD